MKTEPETETERERSTYVEDEVLVGSFPCEATSEVYRPDQNQNQNRDPEPVRYERQRSRWYS